MSEPNPYEPPREPEPLKTGRVIKRGMGLMTLLILTPLAVGIAALISCGATGIFVTATLSKNGSNIQIVTVAGWIIFLTPPVLAFLGMLWLAGKGNETGPKK